MRVSVAAVRAETHIGAAQRDRWPRSVLIV